VDVVQVERQVDRRHDDAPPKRQALPPPLGAATAQHLHVAAHHAVQDRVLRVCGVEGQVIGTLLQGGGATLRTLTSLGGGV
jgi:hypothetical protein